MSVNIDALVKAAHYNEVLGRNVGLESQVQQLKTKNRQLLRRVHESSKPWQDIHQALEDSILLLSLHAAGLPTSRRYCEQSGAIPRRRWNRAWKLLRIAKVAEYSAIVDRPQAENIQRLNDTFEDFQRHPKAFRRPAHTFGVVTTAPRKRDRISDTNQRQNVTHLRENHRDRRAEIEQRHARKEA